MGKRSAKRDPELVKHLRSYSKEQISDYIARSKPWAPSGVGVVRDSCGSAGAAAGAGAAGGGAAGEDVAPADEDGDESGGEDDEVGDPTAGRIHGPTEDQRAAVVRFTQKYVLCYLLAFITLFIVV